MSHIQVEQANRVLTQTTAQLQKASASLTASIEAHEVWLENL